jgi:serine/threonine protein kinase/WD40 repeat protein
MIQSVCESRDDQLGQAANEYFEAIARGETPSIAEYAERYPEIAEDIRRVFPALALVGDSTSGEARQTPFADAADCRQLGDYRILREIGRGGMGIVYEAEQLSLGRRVALKVLPFAAVMDDKAIVRFKNEARAAATLDHPNIVPIHAVGNERGVYFYAMQLIEGQTLAEVVEQLRKQRDARCSILDARSDRTSSIQHPTFSIDTRPIAALSTLPAFDSREYFRAIARIGVQAARALQHAHEHGIVHRDIKPGNLMIQCSHLAPRNEAATRTGRGPKPHHVEDRPWRTERDGYTPKLWITDFGLARISSDASMTMTGDLLGTIRYMAPEQALGQHVVVDHRADIYSLGVTLYELLALRPAFDGHDRQSLLKQIALDNPKQLRAHNSATPADLETIVTKAIAREPNDRYQSADNLADDLERYLAHKPIVARPPTPLDRATKWLQRRIAFVAISGIALVALSGVLLVGMVLLKNSESRALAALEQTSDLLYTADMALAYETFDKGWSDEVQAILDRQRPIGPAPDRRGFEWHLLHALSQPPDSVALSGHHGPVNELAVFPDRQRLASVGDDGTLRIWDVREKRLLKTITVCKDPLYSVAVSRDGQWAAVGSTTLYLCDLVTGGEVRELFLSNTNLESIAFSPDGAYLAVGSRHRSVCLVSLDGEVVECIPCESRVQSLDYVPGTQSLLLPNRRPTMNARHPIGLAQIWDDALQNVQVNLDTSSDNYRGAITVAKSSPCGQYIAAGEGLRGRVFIFNRESGSVLAKTSMSRDRLTDLAYSPDGNAIAIGFRNGRFEYLRLQREAENALAIDQRPIVVNAHQGEVFCIGFFNSSTMATCGADGLIRIWDLTKNRPQTLDNPNLAINGISLSPDGRRLLYTCAEEAVLFDVDDGKVVRRLREPQMHYNGAVWSSAADRAAVYDLSSNRVDILDRDGRTISSITHESRPSAVALSHDGSHLAIVSKRQVQLCRARDGEEVFRRAISAPAATVVFSHNGNRLAYGGEQGILVILETAQWQTLRQLSSHSVIRCLAFNPDDSVIASGHNDGSIYLWDTRTGELQAELVGHELGINSLAFSPDGRTLISTGEDGAIRVWSVLHGRAYGVAYRSSSPGTSIICKLSLSANGHRLAVAHSNKHNRRPDLLLWDIGQLDTRAERRSGKK